jgi:glutamine amidotransferase
MQMMGNSSDEGQLKGLNWIDGTVKKFDETKINQITKLPHMGWNDVVPKEGSQLFSGLENTSIFYFLHSFYFHCGNDQDIIATSDYGEKFTCAINHKNMYGIQFHPEKSHHYGEKLLLNFANL